MCHANILLTFFLNLQGYVCPRCINISNIYNISKLYIDLKIKEENLMHER